MTNREIVERFEDEFKNRMNIDIVDELMAPDFVHHLPYPGLRDGRDGMCDVGHFVFGAIRDIHVTVDLILAEGDLVADRVSATGIRTGTDAPIAWFENHIYRVVGGQIRELWPAGGPELG